MGLNKLYTFCDFSSNKLKWPQIFPGQLQAYCIHDFCIQVLRERARVLWSRCDQVQLLLVSILLMQK